jgi:hypothetical protein
MINMRNNFQLFSAVLALLFSSQSFAGGPLVLEGPAGNTPVSYENPSIIVHAESGRLGDRDNSDANELVQQAFSLWNDVSSATVKLIVDTTTITEDINLDNFDEYLPNLSGTELNGDDGLNPIVYDDDGEIIDAYFGVGQSSNTVGFAASILTQGGSYFDEGYAVINGKDLNLSTTTFKLLITHEIGHFIGLDHSQTDINNAETTFGFPRVCETSPAYHYPVMYPFICRDDSTLYIDDIIAVSALYPSATFSSEIGIIEGNFVDENNLPILGANIWAENVDTGEVVSIVSDYLMQSNGYYRLHLVPGDYTLHVNSINTEFNGGSGIGPYTDSILDLSFTDPHPLTPVSYQGETAGDDEVITVTAGQTQTIIFSSEGLAASVILPVAADGSRNDDIADLFGATSHITLLLLAGLLMLARRFSLNRDQAV